MQLSQNFTLEEFLTSQTAVRNGIDNLHPPDEVIRNLGTLCIELLQPLRNALGPLRISSGYRCLELNRLVHSKDDSQHILGMAADVQYFENGEMNNQKILRIVIKSGFEYDQMINEFGFQWIHLSFNKGNNRKMLFNKG